MATNSLIEILQNDNAIKQLADELLTEYKRALTANNVNASGQLHDTASSSVEVNGSHLQIFFELQDYWYYVENGRKPGKRPPISAIERWIENKKIVPHANDKGKVPTTKQLAFAISKTIGEKGTQYYQMGGSTLLQAALDDKSEVIDAIIDRISELVQHEIDRELVNVFGN